MAVNTMLIAAKVKRAANRKRTLLALDKPMMPSELLKKIYNKNSSTYFNIVSRALAELVNLKLVKVINPKEKTGRIYELTNLGKKVKGEIES